MEYIEGVIALLGENGYMKVLNNYSGIGGNRKLWTDCEVTAVENDLDIAEVYRHFFPQDDLYVYDAHKYLLECYKDFDFIWSSPPCQTHSSVRKCKVGMKGYVAKYPDMSLYQEIILLSTHIKPKDNILWLVENVKPYYKPLIAPTFQLGRHNYWANFTLPQFLGFYPLKRTMTGRESVADLEILKGFKLHNFKLGTIGKRQALRNAVTPGLGNYLLEHVKKIISDYKGYSRYRT